MFNTRIKHLIHFQVIIIEIVYRETIYPLWNHLFITFSYWLYRLPVLPGPLPKKKYSGRPENFALTVLKTVIAW